MAQISIIKLKDIKEAKRFDAEYFKPVYLEDEKKIQLKNWDFLRNLYVFNSRYKQPIYNEHSDIKIINSQYLREDKIDYEPARNGINKLVPYEAVMINSTGIGTLGRVNINYLKDKKISVDSHINIIVTNYKINPYYLTIFLQSKFGKNQIERNISGSSGQIEIYPRDFDKFKIPLLNQSFQLQIEKIVKEAYQKQSLSKKLYKEAEQILLEELDLVDFKPKHKLTFTTTKKAIEEAKRFDAEYFQPKYKEIIEKIKSYKGGWDYLGNLTTYINNGNQPPYTENGEIKFFSQKWIKDKEIDYSFLESDDEPMVKKDFFEIEKNKQSLVGKGDILFYSVGANLGYCHTYLEDEEIAVGSFINIIRANKNKVNEIFLGFLLNSIIGRLQSEKMKSGIAQPYIYAKELKQFIIPLISPQIQTQIAKKIEESFKLRKESKELLEKAKKMVEEEIKNA